MARSWIVTALLLMSIAAVARTQYFDLLQGFQQLFQQYHPNKEAQNRNDVTRHPSVRQPNKQKTDERRSNEQRKKKPIFNEFDYLLATTVKPSRKNTKSSSQTKVASHVRSDNKNSNTNTGFVLSNQEPRTESNRNKPATPKTTISNSIGTYTTTTTENIFIFNLNNRDSSFNVRNGTDDGRKSEKYVAGTAYDTNSSFNNKGTVDNNFYDRATTNSNRNINNDNYVSTNSNLRNNQNNHYERLTSNDNRPNNNYGATNNEPKGNRNVNVANLNDRTITDTLNTNSGNTNNRGINNNENRPNNNKPEGSRNVNVANLNEKTGSNSFYTRAGSTNNREIFNNANRPNNNRETINRRNTDSTTGTSRGRTINTEFNNQVHSFGFVTESPWSNRPGARPAVANNPPPITNRPINDNIFFPNSDEFPESDEPELLIGPDEEGMTNLQRQRYVDLAERMCDRYKALNVKKLVALPPSLIPSPDPVEFNVTSCNPFYIPLVIGGKVVDIKEYPHMGLIGWKKVGTAGYSWKCGGSLISDQYVLTAGHCTFQDKDINAVSGLPHVVQLGSSYLDDPGAQVVKITSVIRHPKYKRKRAYYDVAMVKMIKRVSFSEVIKPACIGVAPPVGNNIVATGWGRTEFGGDHSQELRSVSLPIWGLPECRAVWETSRKLPYGPSAESHVCAGDRTGEKDTCQGDSGGPAQVQDGCVWRVVAVTSIGKSCGAALTPALYAVVSRAFVAAQVFGDEVDYGGGETPTPTGGGRSIIGLGDFDFR